MTPEAKVFGHEKAAATMAAPPVEPMKKEKGHEHFKEKEHFEEKGHFEEKHPAMSSKVPKRGINSRRDTAASALRACPGELTGRWESPRLIVPVDHAHPNTAYGKSDIGEVSSTISSVFKFSIPGDSEANACTVVFLVPDEEQHAASSEAEVAFNMTGSGAVEFTRLGGNVDIKTTLNNLPDVAQSYRRLTVAADNAYTIDSFACTAGSDVVVEMASVPSSLLSSSGETELKFRQHSEDDGKCPLGLYVLTSTSEEDVEL